LLLEARSPARARGFALGLDCVHLPASVPIPAKLGTAPKVSEDIQGGAHVIVEARSSATAGDKPVCVAETAVRVYTG
jgi:hypothetical protein